MRARRIVPHLALLAAPALAIALLQGWSAARYLNGGGASDAPSPLNLLGTFLPLLDTSGNGIRLAAFPLLCIAISEGLEILGDRRRQARLRRLAATRHLPVRRLVRRFAAVGAGLGTFLLLALVLTMATIALFFGLRPAGDAGSAARAGLFVAILLVLHWLSGVAVIGVYRRVSQGPHERAPQLRGGIGAKRRRLRKPAALADIALQIDDQRLYADSILFEGDKGRLTVPLEIARHDRAAPPRARWLGLAEQSACPLVIGELILRNVRSFEVEDPAFVGIYAVTGIRWEPPLLTLEAAPDLVVSADLSAFDVELVLTRAPVGLCSTTRWLGLLETEWRRRGPAPGG